jgi:2-isopropylmalate synthase
LPDKTTKVRTMGNEQVKIFDTTLRDGEQAPSYAMSIEGKERMAKQLALLNVDIIEAGFPISSPAQYEAVQRISDWAAKKEHSPVIAALARATKGDIDEAASALESVIDAGRGRIHTFIATSHIHMKHKLKKTPDEVRAITAEMVRYAGSFTPDVEFSLEDATRTKLKFMHEIIRTALDNGATTINIPDTVGCALPEDFYGRIKSAYCEHREFRDGLAAISVHCHNDYGLAVANSLAAVRAGARQVECSVNGIGERAGNAALEEVVMALKAGNGLYCASTGIRTRQIYQASRAVAKETGIDVQPNKAIVGRNAFAHEAGIHQHGMLVHKSTYEAINPEDVGRKTRIVLGRHSGKHAVIARLEQLGIKCDIDRFMQQYRAYADRCKEVDDSGLRQIAAEIESPAVK